MNLSVFFVNIALMELIKHILGLIHRLESYFQVTSTGYAEHFIAGVLIGGFVSFVMIKRTNRKLQSLIVGLSVALMIGLFKELIDPYMRGDRDKTDLVVTALGGLLGCLLMLSKRLVPGDQLKKRFF